VKCSDARTMITRYLDEGLDQNEARLFELHIVECEACRKVMEQDMAIHKLFSATPRFEAPLGFAATVMARLEEQEIRSTFWRFLTVHPVLLRTMEAAFALLVLAIGIISGSMLTANRTPEQPATLQETFSLDVFDSSPPGSVGGIYIALSGENNER